MRRCKTCNAIKILPLSPTLSREGSGARKDSRIPAFNSRMAGHPESRIPAPSPRHCRCHMRLMRLIIASTTLCPPAISCRCQVCHRDQRNRSTDHRFANQQTPATISQGAIRSRSSHRGVRWRHRQIQGSRSGTPDVLGFAQQCLGLSIWASSVRVPIWKSRGQQGAAQIRRRWRECDGRSVGTVAATGGEQFIAHRIVDDAVHGFAVLQHANERRSAESRAGNCACHPEDR